MAKTKVTTGSLNGSFRVSITIWPGCDEGVNELFVYLPGITVDVMGMTIPAYMRWSSSSYHGAGKLKFTVEGPLGAGIGDQEITIPIDAPEEFIWDFNWSFSGTMLDETVITNPIGDKGITHSKEVTVKDEWHSVGGATLTTTGPEGHSLTLDVTPGCSGGSQMQFGPVTPDPDGWGDIGKYAIAFKLITFCGNIVDCSAFSARNFYGASELWVEGTADGTIGLWGDNYYTNYPVWDGVTVTAPYVYDFSNLKFKWMDGQTLNASQKIYCTAIRTLGEDGKDPGGFAGDWHGTIAELQNQVWKQKYGIISEDTYDPDILGDVQIYLDMVDAESNGIEIRGPAGKYKVENAGFGLTGTEEEPIPGPVDGYYSTFGIYNGQPSYDNGSFYMFCLDEEENSWGIGPDFKTPPYYIQVGSGPAGVYLVNLWDKELNPTGYKDMLVVSIEDPEDDEYDTTGEGQRIFSGFAGYGQGPVVTEESGNNINVNSDCAIPSFKHNATFIFQAWHLKNTNREDDNTFTGVATLTPDDDKTIYSVDSSHTDWVPSTGVTTPDEDGYFTVNDSGSLTYIIRCNYRSRQSKVGGEGQVAVPLAYLGRRQNTCIGQGDPPEEPEDVWDWRVRYLSQDFMFPETPTNITCTIKYYMDLDGCSDNHFTDSTRQTEYSYDPGELYTLTRTIPITYSVLNNGEYWSPVIIDLYDEQNSGLPVAMAYSLKWEFEGSGTYRMRKPHLIADHGDRQEVTDTTPFYREEPSSHAISIKSEESWKYGQGVFSGHRDGFYRYAIFTPDNKKPCQVEKCQDTINVLIGAKTGLDMSASYALSGWVVGIGNEAWTYKYHSEIEDYYMLDEDGARLATLTTRDIVPQMGNDSLLAFALRCYSITCVRGLRYNFQGVKYVGGRGHGMGIKSIGAAFPRQRGGANYDLYRRPIDSESQNDYALVEEDLTPDEHGHWETSAQSISAIDEDRTLWEYAILAGRGFVSLGRFATLEYAQEQVRLLTQKIKLASKLNKYLLIVATDVNGEIEVYRSTNNGKDFTKTIDNVDIGPSFVRTNLVMLATDEAIYKLDDFGKSAIEVVQNMPINGTNPVLFNFGKKIFLLYMIDDSIYIAISYDNGATFTKQDILVASGASDQYPTGIVRDDASMLVAYHKEDDNSIYTVESKDGGITWETA